MDPTHLTGTGTRRTEDLSRGHTPWATVGTGVWPIHTMDHCRLGGREQVLEGIDLGGEIC